MVSTSNASPRVSDVRMFRISPSTNAFFFMFARHIRSGRPVLADWAWTNSSAVCVPSPIGSVAFMYSSPARPTRAISSSIGNLAQRFAGALRLPHVALDQPAVGAADAGDRLAGRKVHDLVDVDARVGLPPAENRNIQHVSFKGNSRRHEDRNMKLIRLRVSCLRGSAFPSTPRPSWSPRSRGTGGRR